MRGFPEDCLLDLELKATQAKLVPSSSKTERPLGLVAGFTGTPAVLCQVLPVTIDSGLGYRT